MDRISRAVNLVDGGSAVIAGPYERPRAERRGLFALPRDADPYLRAWLHRHALSRWRAADSAIRRMAPGPTRDAHERAVAVAMEHVGAISTVDGLMEHWRTDRYRRAGDVGDPRPGTVEAWIAEACRAVEGGTEPERDLIAGAALWRRAQQLIGARVS